MDKPDKNGEIGDWMIHYFYRDISECELEKLYRWLQESQENKDFFFQLKGIYDLTRRHTLLSAGEVERSWLSMQRKISAHATIIPGQSSGKKVFLRSLKYIAVAAAAAVLGFVISNYHTGHTLPRNLSPAEKVSYHEIHIHKGSKPGNITLSDGTRVQLNVAGTLRYPSNFFDAGREVFLDGEAWFEVAGDGVKPFIVHLKQQTITVHGTCFNVEAYENESCNIVTLLSGSISLETHNHAGEHISNIFLKPGQKAHFDMATGSVSVEKVDAAMSNTWVNGEYKFIDKPLEFIVKRLENYYNVSISLDDDSLKHIRYTGTFSFGQSIEQVLRIINYEQQFSFRQSGNAIHIKMLNL
jgi:ferric-dicitrate binding protein FerR (iron transport regulator)